MQASDEPTAVGLLPQLPGNGVPLVNISPLETYLATFSNAVATQLSAMKAELSAATTNIADLQAALTASEGKVHSLEHTLSTHVVSKASLAVVLRKLSVHLNELDPSFVEGEGGPASWLATAVVPNDNITQYGKHQQFPTSSPTVASTARLNTFGSAPSPTHHLHNIHSAAQQNVPHPSRPTEEGVMSGVSSATTTPPPGAAPRRGGAPGDPKMRNFIRSEIAAWYQETGLPDAEVRHAATVSSLSKQLSSIKESIAEKVSTVTVTGLMETLRADLRLLREDGAAAKKRMLAFEADTRDAMQSHAARVWAVHQHASNRIDQVYSMFGLQEPYVAPLSKEFSGGDDPMASEMSVLSREKKSSSNLSSAAESRSSSPPPPLQRGQRGGSGVQFQSKVTPAVSTSLAVSDEDRAESPGGGGEGGDVDSKTRKVLQCASFIALRQRVLDDIVERISSSRHAQASDVGLEMFALRNDLKQRPTSQRVVEMIGEQVNIPGLIARCDALSKQLTRIDREVVKQGDFNVALKTKADVNALEQRISREEFDMRLQQVDEKHATIDETMKLIMDERQELSHIFRDVVAYHKRDTAAGASRSGGAAEGTHGMLLAASSINAKGGGQLGMLRLHESDDADGHLQSIMSGSSDPRADSRSSKQAPSRNSRKGTSSMAVLKPITENRAQSQNIPIPPHGSRLQHQQQHQQQQQQRHRGEASSAGAVLDGSNGPALPLTTNQQAYARVVSEDQLRSQLDHLPPLPYERSPRGPPASS